MASDSDKKRRAHKPADTAVNLLIVLLIGVMLFSGWQLFKAYQRYHTGTKAYKSMQAAAGTDSSGEKAPDFKALRKKYKDVKAWLYQKDTVINYPVVQGKDNQYYLYRLPDGTWNVKGSLFIDFRNKHPFNDFLTVIYGHRMKDHSMFWHIADFRDPDYYKKHKQMTLFTPGHTYTLKIFAAETIPSKSRLYRFDFRTATSKAAYLKKIRRRSDISPEIKVSADDRIVMLSTCTYEYQNARAVVFAKLVERK